MWVVLAVALLAHRPAVHAHDHGGSTFTENRGQWPAQVLYRVLVPDGAVFVEADGLTVVQYADLPLQAHGGGTPPSGPPRAHAYRVKFEDGSAQAHTGELTAAHYENHFIGRDPAGWGTRCAVHGAVLLREVWPGIDIRFHGDHGLKYDVLVAPGADPAQARLRYVGHDRLELMGDEVHVALSTGIVVEGSPVAFHADGSPVEARYRVRGDVVHFELPGGYDATRPLVIDPTLSFSSFSGSSANNFGFTATYDNGGHLYGGGTVFGPGYPVSLGAFDPSFHGGFVDVGVSKWTPDGSALVWSTYYGGAGADAPHSMVVNSNNELYVFGSTGSDDLPTTPGCFSPTFLGGPALNFAGGYGFAFPNGADAFLVHFSNDATALIGSTYIGGIDNDAVNNSALNHNYGDPFRGEVALDAQERPVVATCTRSLDMPTTPGAPQPQHGGAMDGYVFRMDPALSTMLWATFRGGSDDDALYGVQFNSNGEVYVAGGTRSADLPMAGQPLQNALSGGTDGHVARYAANGSLLGATYLGTPVYDQVYFVQVDVHDNVYVVGQTYGDYPVSPGVYSNPGSGMFIHKMAASLGTSHWSTRLGNGSTDQDLSPSAFLVSDCGQIFLSAWGGLTNNIGVPQNSTTLGLPVTDDALQEDTDGSDFYLMVLAPDAAGLSYATYFGGTSNEHVDGGTSRFDKNGMVYQAVCAGCGGGSFPTTPGVAGPSNGSSCNLGVFKFDLRIPHLSIAIDGDDQFCAPGTVQFINNSTGGSSWLWDFGDGGTSTAFAPQHTYTEPGEYVVTMVLTDDYGCTLTASDSLAVHSMGPPEVAIESVPPQCPGATFTLVAGGDAQSWQWNPAPGLADPTAGTTTLTATATTTYQLVGFNDCGSDTAWITVEVREPQVLTVPDTLVCPGAPVPLQATGGVSYEWAPDTGLDDPLSDAPIAIVWEPITYTVTSTDAWGCTATASVHIDLRPYPELSVQDPVTVAWGDPAPLNAMGVGTFQWDPPLDVQCPTCPHTWATVWASTTFTVTLTDMYGCAASAPVHVIVEGSLHVPNTFTPNGDGTNDLFGASGEELAWFELRVFDRWGVEVFHTDRIEGRWDGTHQGRELPIGVYVWTIEAQELAGRRHERVGHVTLLR